MRRLSLALALLVLVLAPLSLAYAAPRVITRRQKKTSRVNHSAIEVAMPQIVGKSAGAKGFNASVRVLYAAHIARFQRDARAWASPEYQQHNPFAGQNSEMDLSYEVTFNDAHYISIFVSEYTSFPGAAHPNTNSFTLNYDLLAHKRLSLTDGFKPGISFLGTLSSYSTAALRPKLGDELDLAGLAPKGENFSDWNLTSRGLRFTFDAYQVASYASGPQEVVVPYSALRYMVRTDRPFAMRDFY